MALIICPECGNQVSSNAKQCVHCGCKFTACPECGNVSVGKLNVCDKCGYGFSVEGPTNHNAISYDSNNNEFKSRSAFDTDIISSWKEDRPLDAFIVKYSRIIFSVCALLMLFPMVFVELKFFDWMGMKGLEKVDPQTILKLKDTTSAGATFLCMLMALVLSFGAIFEIYSPLRCCSWMKSKGIDGVGSLRASADEKTGLLNLANKIILKRAVYYAENPKDRIKFIMPAVAGILLCMVSCFFLYTFIVDNALEFIRVELSGSELLHIPKDEFVIKWDSLILTGMIYGIGLIIDSIGRLSNKKRVDYWYKATVEQITE